MFKRLFSILAVVLLLTVNASASKLKLFEGIEPDGEFYVYGQDDEKIAELLNIEQNELNTYFADDTIKYFAVSKDNKKQIKLSFKTTDFSSTVINLSDLSNDSILTLAPDIIGVEGIKGEILEKQGQKFIKIQLKTADSGGEYILTEYITVAGRYKITLSFYTQYGTDRDYIEGTFNSFTSPLFVTEEKDTSAIQYVILIGGIIFGVICVIIMLTVFFDLKRGKKNKSDFSQEETE